MSGVFIPLGEVASFIRGITYKPIDLVANFSTGSIVCMRTANVQAELDESNLLSIPQSFVKGETKILREGDLLVSTANSWNLVGKCCWVPALKYPATVGGFIAALRGDEKKVDPRYLYHWFSSPKTQANARNCGRQTTNISNMDIGRCLALEIPLPDLPEQRRIAAILDKAGALRAKRREAIVKLDQLLQSVFIDMFGDPVLNPKGWPIVSMLSLTQGKYGVKAGPFGSALKKEFYTQSGYRVYGQEQVIAGKLDVGNYYIDQARFESLKSCAVRAGDLLISLVGSFGKILIVPNEFEPGIINPRLLKLTPDQDNVLPEFLKHYFQNESVQNHLEGLSHGGTMGILNAGLIKQLVVPLPPMSVQQRFVSCLDAISSQQSRTTDSEIRVSSLFQALQQSAFSGQLVGRF